jgi:hypothetical protein
MMSTVIVFAVACGNPDDQNKRSTEALICLSPTERQRVAEAAVLLRLASPAPTPDQVVDDGRQQSVAQWRDSQRQQFEQACAVVVAAGQLEQAAPSGGGDGGMWKVLWPLLIGSLLTLVVTLVTSGWRERSVEVRRHATELRKATTGYVSTVREFGVRADDRTKAFPPAGPLDDARRRLQEALDETPRPAGAPGLDRARQLLGAGALGADLGVDWSLPQHRDRDGAFSRSVRQALDELRSSVEDIIRAREQPIRTFARGNPFRRGVKKAT